MKFQIGFLSLILSTLAAHSASATECLTPESKRVMLIAVVSRLYSDDAKVHPDGKKMDDGSLVCVLFGKDAAGKRIIQQLEFVNDIMKEREAVPFTDLVKKGYSTIRTYPVVGTTKISVIKCPNCTADANKVTLEVKMLTKYKLIGGNNWRTVTFDVDMVDDGHPQPIYKDAPFDVMTIRSEGGMGGGAKQMRFSQCNEARDVCLSQTNPIVKHVKTIGL